MKYAIATIILLVVFVVWSTLDRDQLNREIIKDQIIIKSLENTIKLKNDSLAMADQAIEDIKTYYDNKIEYKVDSINNFWENATDDEIRRRVRANRRD